MLKAQMINISNDKLNSELKKFLQIYKDRPINDNKGGMKINHMFGLFVLLKKLKPKYIIESGVFKGQGTWLIEKTLPKSKIYSIDIDLNQREYISNQVIYLNKDFKFFDRKIIPEKTLAFFDDHTCSIDRIKQCKFINIKQIIFEDNYDIGDGDFNSLKYIFKKQNFIHNISVAAHFKTLFLFFIEILKKMLSKKYIIDIEKITFRLRDRNNRSFSSLVLKNIDFKFEFPKISSFVKNKEIKKYLNDNYSSEQDSYNSLTFIKIK